MSDKTIIKGLPLKAYDKNKEEVKHFEVFFMQGVAYGVKDLASTNREILQLEVQGYKP